MKREPPVSAAGEHPIKYQRVHVDVEIERPTKPLDNRHPAAARIGDAVCAGPIAQVSRHLAEQRADNLLHSS